MSETDGCTPEKLLEGFSKMSPEDQEKVRTMLGIEAASNTAEPCCDMASMMGMMKMMSGKKFDPNAMCKEMMEKCKQPENGSPQEDGNKKKSCC